MVYFITRDVAVVTDLWCLAQVWIRRASDERRRALTSTAFVSEEKETSARGRLVGIARAVHRRSRLRVSFSCLVCFPLVVVLWCVGNPDLWDRGLVCFWGTFLLWLVYPNLPIAWAQARARITFFSCWTLVPPCVGWRFMREGQQWPLIWTTSPC